MNCLLCTADGIVHFQLELAEQVTGHFGDGQRHLVPVVAQLLDRINQINGQSVSQSNSDFEQTM